MESNVLMNRPRLLLGDDHAIVSEGLVRLLEPHFDIVGSVGDGRALVTETERLRPDVVVFDIGMPLLNGIEAARQIRSVLPNIKLVCLTQQAGKEYVQAAFRLGGAAYVVKNSAASELVTAINEALAGHYYLSPQLRDKLPEDRFTPEQNPAELFGKGLTPRQREVLQLVAEGKTAKEIAHVLGISTKTVEFHKAAIMDELSLRTTAELTRYALDQGILQH